ncbi:hypothetical protein [Candidatus Mycobacterium methanotrophicum]|uniref:Thiamine pyrophosphate enzyme N-terminal TPP-binding domain-containing protein n=2 Tax=Candidatus Mycobacterium methanotrophicum TaxID=2943498 RepID=A0ABY4QJ86_9MYCO|nr:hypothetical protein [Candidatus Mycobacterium methanotrophicum]UQX09745.1 hypothetical protein M5I08_15680 [Candidatus Mycobacterium methanotrophicum]
MAGAAVNPDLAALISWSSVENAGVITTGFGVALVGASVGQPKLVAAGLVAGTAQVMAHALGETLLFVSASTIEHVAGTTDLDSAGRHCAPITLGRRGFGDRIADFGGAAADQAAGANAKPWVLQPVFDDFSALPPSWLELAMDRATADGGGYSRVRDVVRRP